MTAPVFRSQRLPAVPDLLALHRQFPQRYPFALISTAGLLDSGTGMEQARYDILFACPQQSLVLRHDYRLTGVADCHRQGDFLHSFNRWFANNRIETTVTQLPFTGGWFVYLAYELAQQIEPRLRLPAAGEGDIIACATRIPAAVIVDHRQHIATVVAENEFAACIDSIAEDIAQLTTPPSAAIAIAHCDEDDEAPYLEQVARIKQYIVDGDIFQANLSRQWWLGLANQPPDSDIFKALARANPASFAALARFDDFSIISSSPERLVSVRDGVVETRPIAGTRPRASGEDDARLSQELMQHPKEQAEHIMLIDLERNDLGRICQPGSIHVNELLTLESWQHVHHIVSNIRGELKPGVLPGDVLRAMFPGGTITGCPKVRCMEILAEQEQQARGAYTGSLGYINRDGSMDSNILIRTLVRRGRQIHFRAGGGIVADSEPQAELAETRAKATGLLKAFEH